MATVSGFPRDSYAFSAGEVGDALAGLVRRDGSGAPVEGVLGDPLIAVVPSSWQVAVGPFIHVERVSGGVRFSGESATEHVDITPAAGSIPSGEARIDLVCWDTSVPELVVVDGTPDVSPSVPSDGGMVPLAQVRVNAGDGQTIEAQVTDVADRTGLVSGSRADQGDVAKRNVAAGSLVRVPVTFPVGLFTAVPNVQATVWGTERNSSVTVDNRTTSGCDILISNNAAASRQLGAMWRAEQL